MENAEHASIDPLVGKVDSTEGNLSVSPVERTEYTLTMFGRDGVTERQRITIDVQPRRREKPKSEVTKKSDKSSTTPGPRVRESSAGTRGATGARSQGGSLQIGIGPAGVRIPVGGGTRAPTATPKPRIKVQTGIGRGITYQTVLEDGQQIGVARNHAIATRVSAQKLAFNERR